VITDDRLDRRTRQGQGNGMPAVPRIPRTISAQTRAVAPMILLPRDGGHVLSVAQFAPPAPDVASTPYLGGHAKSAHTP
jgi:hypothetical protein